MTDKKLILASGSPRRREILASAGYDFRWVSPKAEEVSKGLSPEELVAENARRKARAALETEDGVIRLTFREKSIVFDFPSDGYTFKTVIYKGKNPVIGFEKGRILCRYCDFDFAAVLSDAVCEIHEDGYVIIPDNKSFEIKF